jgi:tetratricopeptide (TPR) repeat protein
MKLKPLYIYIGVFVIALIALVLFDSKNQPEISDLKSSSDQMPNDEIHKGIEGKTPSAGNVSESFKQKMNDLKEQVEANPNDTAKVKEYADLLSASHKPDEAIEQFESILAKDGKRIDILLPLVYLYFTKQNIPKAEEYTKRVLAINPNHAQAHYNLGALEATKGNSDKAKEIWEMIVKKYPNTEAAHIAEQSLKQL